MRFSSFLLLRGRGGSGGDLSIFRFLAGEPKRGETIFKGWEPTLVETMALQTLNANSTTTVNSVSNTVMGTINGYPIKMLIDSRANTSMLCADTFNHIKINDKLGTCEEPLMCETIPR